MTLDSEQIVSVVEIVCYAPILPLVGYLAFRHGLRGLLGYFYLNAACVLRAVYDIVDLVDKPSKNGTPSLGTTILGSVGLTPLILALAGFIHEAHLDQLENSGPLTKKSKAWLWFLQIQFHGIAVVGIVLIIIGNVKLYEGPYTPSDINTYNDLRKAGAVLLLVLIVFLIHYCAWVAYKWPRTRSVVAHGQKELTLLTLLACVFVLAKVAYTVAYSFDPSDHSLSPIDGSLAVKVVFIFIIPYAAVCSLTLGGWKSRNKATNRPMRHRGGSGSSLEHETVRIEARDKVHYGRG